MHQVDNNNDNNDYNNGTKTRPGPLASTCNIPASELRELAEASVATALQFNLSSWPVVLF